MNTKTKFTRKRKIVHKLSPRVGTFGEIKVALVGAGGSGSQMLTKLVRMDVALRALKLGYLRVDMYDPDIVTTANVGRQLFYPHETGINKSVALVNRVNIGFGTKYRAYPHAYTGQRCEGGDGLGSISGYVSYSSYDFLITCVDSTKARLDILAGCDGDRLMCPIYWLDMGNDKNSGQVVLGQFPGSLESRGKGRLQTVVDLFPREYSASEPEDNTPSCSLAESLEHQDLFINDFMATNAGELLWTLLKNKKIDYQGWFTNLDAGMNIKMPIRPVTAAIAKEKRGDKLGLMVKDQEGSYVVGTPEQLMQLGLREQVQQLGLREIADGVPVPRGFGFAPPVDAL